jgi:NAD(P)-dependent dehydrogenase (short-subunit alcohol dehydrogenase family)
VNVPELFSVAGKVVLITGGTRGIGYSIAEGFLAGGAAKVYLTSRSEEACAEAERALSELGDATAVVADLSLPEHCEMLMQRVAGENTLLDVLVNNSGNSWGAPFDEYPLSAWDRVLGLNVRTPFHLIQLARPLLEAASTADDPARVINIGSIDGIGTPDFENYAYGASKAALHHLTKHLAADLAPSILVNAIAPGPFPTKMMERHIETRGEQLLSVSRLHRFGTPEDAAGAAMFFASRASAYITGALLPLDGGMSTTMKAVV